ncbi:unnamed protein product [Penicillium roqueforti FM164]|uniref:Genomic scaffold, ProqFM164S04 n=1 Tax=Penicillium roqueforti (strain FM164) TaxID=1365484 RepID=W6R2S2_PENRF|nr:unnamed protein product [Penicillium roqueforti FM164]
MHSRDDVHLTYMTIYNIAKSVVQSTECSGNCKWDGKLSTPQRLF